MGATLPCGAQASHCGGFSCCRAQALGVRASVVVAHGLSSCGSWALERRLSSWHTDLVAPRHVGSSQTRDRTCVPCIGRQILNDCATREVPNPGLSDAPAQSPLQPWLGLIEKIHYGAPKALGSLPHSPCHSACSRHTVLALFPQTLLPPFSHRAFAHAVPSA